MKCNLRQASSCDLIQVNRDVLLKKNIMLFLDGFIFNLFQREKTYHYKGNYLSVWKVRRYLLMFTPKRRITKRNFKGGPHDQAVFLYTNIYGIFRVEGFIEFYYKPAFRENPFLPEYFLEATLFTYSIEHSGRCGLETGFNSSLKAHDVWDYCSILRRYQGRTDFVLEEFLLAKKKYDILRNVQGTGFVFKLYHREGSFKNYIALLNCLAFGNGLTGWFKHGIEEVGKRYFTFKLKDQTLVKGCQNQKLISIS